ncbi:MAG: hypothetical protein HC892_00035 [Saprospiraceae bacterium]|nr:hypothetical protein [Saprospiraceae bacterium]
MQNLVNQVKNANISDNDRSEILRILAKYTPSGGGATLHADGSARNGSGLNYVGIGGVIHIRGELETVYSQAVLSCPATNNTAELLAIEFGLNYLSDKVTEFDTIRVFSDSQFAVGVLTTWTAKDAHNRIIVGRIQKITNAMALSGVSVKYQRTDDSNKYIKMAHHNAKDGLEKGDVEYGNDN